MVHLQTGLQIRGRKEKQGKANKGKVKNVRRLGPKQAKECRQKHPTGMQSTRENRNREKEDN